MVEVKCSSDKFLERFALGHRHGAFHGCIPADPEADYTRIDTYVNGVQTQHSVYSISNGVGGRQGCLEHAKVGACGGGGTRAGVAVAGQPKTPLRARMHPLPSLLSRDRSPSRTRSASIS